MAYTYALDTTVASIVDFLLADTNPHNIVTFTPTAAGNYKVSIYFRVTVAATALNLSVTYTDGTGAQTTQIFNNQTLQVGSYHVVELYVDSAANQAITVTTNAGTANQVNFSATIMSV